MFSTRNAGALLLGGASMLATAAAHAAPSRHFNVAHPNVQDSNFRKCFAWDAEKGMFAGGDHFMNSDACNDWKAQAMGWGIPMVLLALFFAFYPVIFAGSRLLFNCCGGRKPSFDCCCPSKDAVANFPGYTRCTVIFTRVLFTLCAVAIVSLSVHSFVAAGQWKGAVEDVANTARAGVDGLRSDFALTEAAVATLHNNAAAPTFVDAATVASVHSAASKVDEVASHVDRAVHDMEEKEHKKHDKHHDDKHGKKHHGHHQGGFPFAAPHVAVALPLFFVVVAVIMMVFKVTGIPVTIVTCLYSFTASLLTTVTIVWIVLSMTTGSLCRNYDATAVPAAIGGLERLGVCNAPAVQHASVSATAAFAAYVQDANTPVCQAIATLAAAGAKVTLCSAKKTAAAAIADFKTTVAAAKVDAAKAPAAAKTIAASEAQLVAVLNLEVLAAKSAKCTGVRAELDGPIAEALCTSKTGLRAATMKLSGLLGGLVAMALVTLFVLVRGIKRFSNMKKTEVAAQLQEEGEYTPLATAEASYGATAQVKEQPPLVIIVPESEPLQQPLLLNGDVKTCAV
jgi:hypothetical protein